MIWYVFCVTHFVCFVTLISNFSAQGLDPTVATAAGAGAAAAGARADTQGEGGAGAAAATERTGGGGGNGRQDIGRVGVQIAFQSAASGEYMS